MDNLLEPLFISIYTGQCFKITDTIYCYKIYFVLIIVIDTYFILYICDVSLHTIKSYLIFKSIIDIQSIVITINIIYSIYYININKL